ncbi:hypothetical protein SAMN00777080_1935 [Aquiflexum balticum DSM 16537]|uniref:Uncharacterized protein n=1 Tax=Aquiflexum balticum DSM 16537 TaxID=758820 RepID=A0A1W2H336_9BACT|nr:DUF6508 domain-containing protein [Aquiflexum balticum]SMD43345.1 hypothetical protein SAMN00777080_1935 [Aquiflexum balticum DSM 16537]
MKPRFTPLIEIETYLKSETGKKAIFSLSKYIPEMESEFQRIKKAIHFDLTEEALLKYVDFDELRPNLQIDINISGLLVDFDPLTWIEGLELLDGIRKHQAVNQIKVCKLMTVIIKRDAQESGYFDKELKKGTFVWLLKNLCI